MVFLPNNDIFGPSVVPLEYPIMGYVVLISMQVPLFLMAPLVRGVYTWYDKVRTLLMPKYMVHACVPYPRVWVPLLHNSEPYPY